MGWLGWIVVGAIAGGLAKLVTGVHGTGCIATTVIGVLGGLLGGILFQAAGGNGINNFSIYSLFVAFVGACALLFLYGMYLRRSGRGE